MCVFSNIDVHCLKQFPSPWMWCFFMGEEDRRSSKLTEYQTKMFIQFCDCCNVSRYHLDEKFRFHSISLMRSLGSEIQHKATLLIKNAESDLRWLENVEWIMNWFHRFFSSLSCTTRYGIHGSSSSTAWHSLFHQKLSFLIDIKL